MLQGKDVKKACILLLCVLGLTACAPQIPKDALQLSPESLQNRQLQTRRFETTNKKAMLAAASAVLQDLGFTLEESEVNLGVLTGSKQRDATSGAQIAGAVFASLLGVPTAIDSHQTIRVSLVMREQNAGQAKPTARLQAAELTDIRKGLEKSIADNLKKYVSPDAGRKIAATSAAAAMRSIETDLNRQLGASASGGDSVVRVTFQRLIFNTEGRVTTAEQIHSPEIYKVFFEKLSKAVFLEAHEI